MDTARPHSKDPAPYPLKASPELLARYWRAESYQKQAYQAALLRWRTAERIALDDEDKRTVPEERIIGVVRQVFACPLSQFGLRAEKEDATTRRILDVRDQIQEDDGREAWTNDDRGDASDGQEGPPVP